MVKALCCHTFARQNLFSPVTRPTAITSSSTWTAVASDDQLIRIYDLKEEPGTLLSEFPSLSKVKSIALCKNENWVATLESVPRSDRGSAQRVNRSIRVYRNIRSESLPISLPRPRFADQPPSVKSAAQKFEVLQFSTILAPSALGISSDDEASQLLVGVDSDVWVVRFDPQLLYFVLQFSINFEFSVCRVAMLGDCVAAGSMEQVHVVRMRNTPPASRFDDEVILNTIAKERKDAKKSIKPLEVIGPTVDFDSASVHFNNNAQQNVRFLETLLYRRFPLSSNIRVHSVQLFSIAGATFIMVANTFEGFLYRVGTSVVCTSDYAFSERTLQARVGSDLLLHVITINGLNTYTTRLGGQGSYSVPKQFPICMIGSLVWREIHMRSLQAWQSGLLLYTERDNLFTLYSLQFQSNDHLFTDMLQTVRQYVTDCTVTSCHLMCEAFHLHSLRGDGIDLDKIVALVEFHMSAFYSIDIENLRQLFVMMQFGLQEIIDVCEKLDEKDVDYKPFLQLYIKYDKMYVKNVRQAPNNVMRNFCKLIMATDPREYIKCVLHRNDRNFFTSQENLMNEVSLDSPEFLLLTCLFLFETSRVDEIDAFIHKGNESHLGEVLKRYSHIVLEEKSHQLTDFAMFLCLIFPNIIVEVVMSIRGEESLPDNLPHCCRLLILEARFSKVRNAASLTEIVTYLLTLLSAKRPSASVCPHKNRRCRQLTNWIASQRLDVLNSFSPFNGIDSTQFDSHCASSCLCVICYSVLLRLQGYLCFSLQLPSMSLLFSVVKDRIKDLPENVRQSLIFLVAHADSVEAGFQALPTSIPVSVAVDYLRRFADDVGGPEVWERMIRRCDEDSELHWAVLRTSVECSDTKDSERIILGMQIDGREEEMRDMMCERFWTVTRKHVFDTMIDQLAS